MPEPDQMSLSLIMEGQRAIANTMAENHRQTRADILELKSDVRADSQTLRAEFKEDLNIIRVVVAKNEIRSDTNHADIVINKADFQKSLNRVHGFWGAVIFIFGLVAVASNFTNVYKLVH